MQHQEAKSQVCVTEVKAVQSSNQDKVTTTSALKFILCSFLALLLVMGSQVIAPRQALADPGIGTLDFVTDPAERGDIDADGYYWNGTDTLTLNGLNLTVTEGDGIILPGGSTIEVTGDSSIAIISENKDTAGIHVENGDLTLTGSGKLTVAGTVAERNEGDPEINASGIVIEKGVLSLSNCVVDSKGSDSALYGALGIEIDSSTIIAEAKTEVGGSYAIYVNEGDIDIRSSTVNSTVSGGSNTGDDQGEQYAILTNSGNINVTNSTVTFDASNSEVKGSGIVSLQGNIAIEGGNIQGKTGEYGDGLLCLLNDTDSSCGKVTIKNVALVDIKGLYGITGPLGIEIIGSNVQVVAEGNAIIAGSGPLTIDSSTVYTEQITNSGTVAISSGGDLTINKSFVEAYANKEEDCKGILVIGDGAQFIVNNNSTVIAEGTEAAIVVQHDDENPDSNSYIHLGAGQKVLEGGQVAYLHTPVQDNIPANFWSYTLGGSISFDNEIIQGASKRVVISHGSAPAPVDPVIPETGDTFPLHALGACLLLGLVCVLIAKRSRDIRQQR